jgi:hypothetical protein
MNIRVRHQSAAAVTNNAGKDSFARLSLYRRRENDRAGASKNQGGGKKQGTGFSISHRDFLLEATADLKIGAE